MKTKTLPVFLISFVLLIIYHNSKAQINIQMGPEITPVDMVEYLIGPGVYYENINFQGADIARGIFSNGNSTNIGIESGIFLTSGSGSVIPGPNTSNSAGVSNMLPGHPLLDAITTATTYDASVLEFDFIPLNDTVRCNFVFGSEEYPEWVGSAFNDVFGFFIDGPIPDTGNYNAFNIALIPGTNIPITINNVNSGSYSEYYVDNSGGATIQYDGFTTLLTLWALVIPDETYHFTIGVADAGDGIYDSGVLIEGTSFKSLGSPEFLSFGFLTENNPGLSFNIEGQIIDNEVFLELPEGTDVTDLVASFEVRGVEVFVDDEPQESGVTANDFSLPLTYHLEGYSDLDWIVYTDNLTRINPTFFDKVVIGPNPSPGKVFINNIEGMNLTVFDVTGTEILKNPAFMHGNSLEIKDLPEGMYFVELEKNGAKETRKLVFN